jgi:hypothetical protein
MKVVGAEVASGHNKLLEDIGERPIRSPVSAAMIRAWPVQGSHRLADAIRARSRHPAGDSGRYLRFRFLQLFLAASAERRLAFLHFLFLLGVGVLGSAVAGGGRMVGGAETIQV